MPRYSAQILEEAARLQIQKGQDYQSEHSTVKQADYYPHGIDSIMDIVNAKYLRMKSVLDKMKHGGAANNESIFDSCIDGINYLSFAAAWLEGEIDGQSPDKDIFGDVVTDDTPFAHIPTKFRPSPDQL